MWIGRRKLLKVANDSVLYFTKKNGFHRLPSGKCMFPRIASTVNHSCDANTQSVTTDGKTKMIFATRWISKGEEINEIYQVQLVTTTKIVITNI